MQEDEFEKNIQNKMMELLIVPDDEVWQKVSVRIAKEKKRRAIFVFWIFLGFLLIAGMSALLMINNFNIKKDVENNVSDNPIKAIDRKHKPTITERRVVVKNIVAAKEKPVAFHQKKEELIYQKPFAKIYAKKFHAIETDITQTSHQTKKIQLQEFKAINKITGKNAKTDISKNMNSLPEKPFFPHKFYNPNLVAKTAEELHKSSTTEKLNFENDSSDKTVNKEIAQSKEVEKKWQFGLTVYSGFANNLSSLIKFGGSYATSASSGTSYSNSGDTSIKFKIGFSFGLGVFVKKQLSKRVSLSTGIDFHTYSVRLKVGNKVAASAIVLYPLSNSLVNADAYYAPGNSVEYNNKYEYVEFPVNVDYRINKNQQKPVLISAGISPGYLVSTNALVGNSAARVFYEDKTNFHHLQFSTQAGLLLPVSSAKKYLLSAGPYVQYGVSNAAKAASGTSQHLFFTGIKATITLK